MDFPCTNKCETFTECRNSVIKKANRLIRVRCRPETFNNLDRFDVYDLIVEEIEAKCSKLRDCFDEDEDQCSKSLVHFIEPHIPTSVPPKEWKHFLELEGEKSMD